MVALAAAIEWQTFEGEIVRSDMEGMIRTLKPPGEDHVVVSRRGVAQNEIVTAIKLYFEGRDLVSVHVLASAATEVLHSLRKNATKATSWAGFEATLSQFMTRSETAEVMGFLKLPYNFFKRGGASLDSQMRVRRTFIESACTMRSTISRPYLDRGRTRWSRSRCGRSGAIPTGSR